MDNQTFRSRLVELMQRSRRAMRAYASVGRSHPGFASLNDPSGTSPRESLEFTELQAEEWRQVNAELLKQLGVALDQPNPRSLIPNVLVVYDRLVSELQLNEGDVRSRQVELLRAAESGDFVKAAVLSKHLVILKARLQATRAAESELEQIVGRLHSQLPEGIEKANLGADSLLSAPQLSAPQLLGPQSPLLSSRPSNPNLSSASSSGGVLDVQPTIELQTSVDDSAPDMTPSVTNTSRTNASRPVPLVHEVVPECGKQLGAAGGARGFGNASIGMDIQELETRPLAKVIRLHKR